jgi:hypothetical protein
LAFNRPRIISKTKAREHQHKPTMDTTALRKRKASANDNAVMEEASQSNSFGLVPDVCWHLIAEFAAPPDGEKS